MNTTAHCFSQPIWHFSRKSIMPNLPGVVGDVVIREVKHDVYSKQTWAVCTVQWNYLYLQWIVGDVIPFLHALFTDKRKELKIRHYLCCLPSAICRLVWQGIIVWAVYHCFFRNGYFQSNVVCTKDSIKDKTIFCLFFQSGN